MNLQELKQRLNEMGFSEEIADKLNEILDAAITKGSLSDDDKQKMTDLIDLDIEAGLLEADAMEKASLAFLAYADGSERAAELKDEKVAEVEADVNDAKEQLEGAMKQEAAPAAPAAPAVTVETTTTTTAPTVPTM